MGLEGSTRLLGRRRARAENCVARVWCSELDQEEADAIQVRIDQNDSECGELSSESEVTLLWSEYIQDSCDWYWIYLVDKPESSHCQYWLIKGRVIPSWKTSWRRNYWFLPSMRKVLITLKYECRKDTITRITLLLLLLKIISNFMQSTCCEQQQ